METDVMIQNLRALAEKHKNDKVYTFETRWTDVCTDVANRLEEQEQKIADLQEHVIKRNLIDSPVPMQAKCGTQEFESKIEKG